MTLRRGPLLAVLLTVFALVWFGPLDYRKLVKPDEGRYAEIPREMVASGDWTTPRLNGIKYFEKPALQYWATATAFTLFGEHHWTARLWSALTGFLGVLLTAYAAARLWGPAAGFNAACVLAGSLLYVLIGHINTLDMGVSFFLSSAIFAFVLAQRDEARPRETRHWMWAAWALLGGAVLSKGLIGLVLPGATLVAYTLWQRDFALWKKLHLLSGLAILLALTVPWFVAVSLANPEFARFFFIHEHFERFLTKAHGRYQPMWYFIPILAVGILPWLVSLLAALRRAPAMDAAHFQPRRFLLLWIVVVFGFFSVSSSKLVSYILPLFPALAALIGWQLARMEVGALRWHALPWIPLGIVAMVLAPAVVSFASPEVPVALYADYVPWLIAAGGCLTAGAAAAFVLSWRGRAHGAVASLAAGGLLFAQLILLGHDSLSPSNSAYHIAQRIRVEAAADIPFFSVNTYDQTLPFYLKRTLTMVSYKDELGFGIAQEPEKFLPDFVAFERAWQEAPKALALMAPRDYQNFQIQGLPMRVLAEDPRRVIVSKP
ncbi:MAG: phospholipid carrier-dependent glycosyltransferase [Rhodocyclales bacterium]|nr:phospholipid carrier-dependent glycosyltransferase [Rhodocyclales bacterium]